MKKLFWRKAFSRKGFSTIVVLLCVSLFASCSAAKKTSSTPSPQPTNSPSAAPINTNGFAFTVENMPRIDGSTATIPLGEAVTSVLLGKPRSQCTVEFSGTNTAYKNLVDKNCDILLVYEPPADALEYTADKIEKTPIGRDALVFLVNTNNPIQSLTTKQIQDIYSGNITNWNQVGGPQTEIKAFQRNETSGSQTLMRKLVMDGITMTSAPVELIAGEMGSLVDAIAAYNNSDYALGYNVYYYVTQMKLDERVKLLSVDGIAPTKASISSKQYPFVNDFYAVIRADEPADSPARIMYNWTTGNDAQTLIDHEGYVAIGVQ